MIAKYLSVLWTAAAPAMGNHLWQSTLFAVAAGLLSLILRKNHARTRYWLWLAASVKFLVPFSLLIGVGNHLSWSRTSTEAQPSLYVTMEQVGRPFTQPTMPMISRATPTTAFSSLLHLLPALLAAVWLCGLVAVLCVWYVGWRRISAAVRNALPLREGREVEALRRLERSAGISKAIEILGSPASLEPGIFGIARPVLLWPEGISGRLEDAHLEAILAHELWHVRRRDNLAAAIHMLVEAIFWFYPLVWWLGTRLLEERERACDQEVLGSGSDRQVYAESILKICEFCVGSPLACVSGVTGADLKKRVVRIMTEGVAHKLDFGRKLLLGAAGAVAVAAPIVFGLVHVTPSRAASQPSSTDAVTPVFNVVSIEPTTIQRDNSGNAMVAMAFTPTGFMAKDQTLQGIIRAAYGVEDDRISGAPDWLNSQRYDIAAKVDQSAIDEMSKLNPEQQNFEQKQRLQALLAGSFKLTLHRETKELPVFSLVIAKNGPKLQESRPGNTSLNGSGHSGGSAKGGIRIEKDGPAGQEVPVASLVWLFSRQLHRTIVDNTGLTGTYDFTLKWPEGLPQGTDNPAPPESLESSISTAIEEQLGLELEPQKISIEVLVIDHVERLAETLGQNIAPTAPPYNFVSVKLNESATTALKTGKGVIRQRLVTLPGEFTSTANTLQGVIKLTYGVDDFQISGAPNWFNSDMYDIEAKADQSVVDGLRNLSPSQRDLVSQRMVQALVEDRFQLKIHHETRDVPVYALVEVSPGKLREVQGNCGPPPKLPVPLPTDPAKLQALQLPCGFLAKLSYPEMGHLAGEKVTAKQLVDELSQAIGRKVLDQTGLRGKYDMKLDWIPEPGQSWISPKAASNDQPPSTQPSPGTSGPSLFTAIQQQLGLKLESQTVPMDILVVDHAAKPSQN
jgi:bla regulator protein blaR1